MFLLIEINQPSWKCYVTLSAAACNVTWSPHSRDLQNIYNIRKLHITIRRRNRMFHMLGNSNLIWTRTFSFSSNKPYIPLAHSLHNVSWTPLAKKKENTSEWSPIEKQYLIKIEETNMGYTCFTTAFLTCLW
jgi:hypothetical protein